MSQTEKLHVIIAGAGIGGLTSALGLARLGVRVTVLERAPINAPARTGLTELAGLAANRSA